MSSVSLVRECDPEMFPSGSKFPLSELGEFSLPDPLGKDIPDHVWEMCLNAPPLEDDSPPEDVTALAEKRARPAPIRIGLNPISCAMRSPRMAGRCRILKRDISWSETDKESKASPWRHLPTLLNDWSRLTPKWDKIHAQVLTRRFLCAQSMSLLKTRQR